MTLREKRPKKAKEGEMAMTMRAAQNRSTILGILIYIRTSLGV